MATKLRICTPKKSRVGAVYAGGWGGSGLPLSPFVVAPKGGRKPFRITKAKRSSQWICLIDVDYGDPATGGDAGAIHMMYHPRYITGWFDFDFDGDGLDDTNNWLYNTKNEGPYNCAAPKVHYGGCNVGMVDGHAEYIKFDVFQDPDHPLWSVQ